MGSITGEKEILRDDIECREGNGIHIIRKQNGDEERK